MAGASSSGREVLPSTAVSVSQAEPTACNPSMSGRPVLPDVLGVSNLVAGGQVRLLPPSTLTAAESTAPRETRVPSSQSNGPEEEVRVHVQDEVLVWPNEFVLGSSEPPPPAAARATTSTSKRSSTPAAVEMETPTPQAERFRPGTRWTREELAAVRHLLRTLHHSPTICTVQDCRTYSCRVHCTSRSSAGSEEELLASRKHSWSAAAEALHELLGHRWVRSEEMTRKRAHTILDEGP